MTAAFATLTFLSSIWLLVVVGSMVLERSGAKIAAALRAQPRQMPLSIATGRIRIRRSARPIGSAGQWRVAA